MARQLDDERDHTAEAMAQTGADVSVIFVPPAFARSAVIEAIDASIPLAVIITEGIAVKDTAEFFAHAQSTGRTRLIGRNCRAWSRSRGRWPTR